MRRWRSLALLAALVLPGCGSGAHLLCTDVGCTSGITVDTGEVARTLRGAAWVTLCIGGRCETERASAANEVGFEARQLRGTERGDGSYEVTLTVSDRRGAAILVASHTVPGLRKIEPNGPRCGPTCHIASLQLRVGKRELVQL